MGFVTHRINIYQIKLGQTMIAKGVTLRGLEVFEALASSGSVAQTAKMTGLSQPAVSQQLSKLEDALAQD